MHDIICYVLISLVHPILVVCTTMIVLAMVQILLQVALEVSRFPKDDSIGVFIL